VRQLRTVKNAGDRDNLISDTSLATSQQNITRSFCNDTALTNASEVPTGTDKMKLIRIVMNKQSSHGEAYVMVTLGML